MHMIGQQNPRINFKVMLFSGTKNRLTKGETYIFIAQESLSSIGYDSEEKRAACNARPSKVRHVF